MVMPTVHVYVAPCVYGDTELRTKIETTIKEVLREGEMKIPISNILVFFFPTMKKHCIEKKVFMSIDLFGLPGRYGDCRHVLLAAEREVATAVHKDYFPRKKVKAAVLYSGNRGEGPQYHVCEPKEDNLIEPLNIEDNSAA